MNIRPFLRLFAQEKSFTTTMGSDGTPHCDVIVLSVSSESSQSLVERKTLCKRLPDGLTIEENSITSILHTILPSHAGLGCVAYTVERDNLPTTIMMPAPWRHYIISLLADPMLSVGGSAV